MTPSRVVLFSHCAPLPFPPHSAFFMYFENRSCRLSDQTAVATTDATVSSKQAGPASCSSTGAAGIYTLGNVYDTVFDRSNFVGKYCATANSDSQCIPSYGVKGINAYCPSNRLQGPGSCESKGCWCRGNYERRWRIDAWGGGGEKCNNNAWGGDPAHGYFFPNVLGLQFFSCVSISLYSSLFYVLSSTACSLSHFIYIYLSSAIRVFFSSPVCSLLFSSFLFHSISQTMFQTMCVYPPPYPSQTFQNN
jgi:hypothetical protein